MRGQGTGHPSAAARRMAQTAVAHLDAAQDLDPVVVRHHSDVAALRLRLHLGDPWWVTGMGVTTGRQPMLVVYVRSLRAARRARLPRRWSGYRVVARRMGPVRPA